MVKGIASWEFPKEQSLVEDKPESGTQKYSKCQTLPQYEKNKLLLNEYLGDFMHFETIFIYFFFAENDFFKPTHPTKVQKILHFFLKPSLKTKKSN